MSENCKNPEYTWIEAIVLEYISKDFQASNFFCCEQIIPHKIVQRLLIASHVASSLVIESGFYMQLYLLTYTKKETITSIHNFS